MKRIIAPLYRDWDEKVFQKYRKEFDLPQKRRLRNYPKG